MRKPDYYRVTWPEQTIGDRREPAGFLDFLHRGRANGFIVIRSAMGFKDLKRIPRYGRPVRRPDVDLQPMGSD